MPVTKYRSVEEMPGETWLQPGDPELYRAVARLWATSRRLRPRRFAAGVTRFRSIEDMNDAHDR
jgi:hypothetical protein